MSIISAVLRELFLIYQVKEETVILCGVTTSETIPKRPKNPKSKPKPKNPYKPSDSKRREVFPPRSAVISPRRKIARCGSDVKSRSRSLAQKTI